MHALASPNIEVSLKCYRSILFHSGSHPILGTTHKYVQKNDIDLKRSNKIDGKCPPFPNEESLHFTHRRAPASIAATAPFLSRLCARVCVCLCFIFISTPHFSLYAVTDVRCVSLRRRHPRKFRLRSEPHLRRFRYTDTHRPTHTHTHKVTHPARIITCCCFCVSPVSLARAPAVPSRPLTDDSSNRKWETLDPTQQKTGRIRFVEMDHDHRLKQSGHIKKKIERIESSIHTSHNFEAVETWYLTYHKMWW